MCIDVSHCIPVFRVVCQWCCTTLWVKNFQWLQVREGFPGIPRAVVHVTTGGTALLMSSAAELDMCMQQVCYGGCSRWLALRVLVLAMPVRPSQNAAASPDAGDVHKSIVHVYAYAVEVSVVLAR